MARISDPTTISNETDEAADLAVHDADLTRGNALHAAAAPARSSSATPPYGTLAQIPWLGRQLYLPRARRRPPRRDAARHPAPAQAVRRRERDAHRGLRAHDRLRLPHRRRRRDRHRSSTALAGGERDAADLTTPGRRTTLKPLFVDKPTPDSVLRSTRTTATGCCSRPRGHGARLDRGAPGAAGGPARRAGLRAARHLHRWAATAASTSPTRSCPARRSQRLRDWAQSYGAPAGGRLRREHRLRLRRHRVERALRAADGPLRDAAPRGPADRRELGHGAQHDYFLGAGAYGVYDEKVLQEATLYGLPFWRFSGGDDADRRRRRRRRSPEQVSGVNGGVDRRWRRR